MDGAGPSAMVVEDVVGPSVMVVESDSVGPYLNPWSPRLGPTRKVAGRMAS